MSVALLAILAPFLAAALILVGRRAPAALALAGTGGAAVAALVSLIRVADGARPAMTLPGLPGLPLRLAADPLGAVLSATVAVVSVAVLVYAVGYMAGDPGRIRFFAGMAFFVAAMQTVVLAADWITLVAAWELIGFASWLLIGFWFRRPGVGAAASRAFVVTRAADVGLYIGAFTLITTSGTSAIAGDTERHGATATVAGFGLLLAAIGKSAQAPLQGWLQDAMVGPTPVSALLHAATLVIAGVVLLARTAAFLPPSVLLVVALVGGVSSILTGAMAVAQTDLKRLLAASTSSQLGLMFLALGAGSVVAAVAHLVAHAAMKGALFLAAGMDQHARDSTAFADLRGIGRRHPAVFAGFVVAGLALAGVPPLAGFWSKDAVLAATWRSSDAVILFPLGCVATALTGAYVARACRLLWGEPAPDAAHAGRPVSVAWRWMGAGLALLALLAATLGLAIPAIGNLLDAIMPEATVSALAGLIAAAVGLSLGWWSPARLPAGRLAAVARRGYRIDGGLSGLVVRPTLALAGQCDRLDAGIARLGASLGRAVLGVAGQARTVDDGLQSGVTDVGRAARAMALASRIVDERGLDGAIDWLVREIRQTGDQARRLQSGRVYWELLLAAAGIGCLLVLAFAL